VTLPNVTATWLTVPDRPDTGMADGYGVASARVLDGLFSVMLPALEKVVAPAGVAAATITAGTSRATETRMEATRGRNRAPRGARTLIGGRCWARPGSGPTRWGGPRFSPACGGHFLQPGGGPHGTPTTSCVQVATKSEYPGPDRLGPGGPGPAAG
jgi:hypothetical protein